jgi:hypothetical protein
MELAASDSLFLILRTRLVFRCVYIVLGITLEHISLGRNFDHYNYRLLHKRNVCKLAGTVQSSMWQFPCL